ncbi:MAG: hypothetical protein H6907_04300 [Hyphomicrobiales bacterium]|nr:hypothetical protein [Hyphomicrobiales bacterium]
MGNTGNRGAPRARRIAAPGGRPNPNRGPAWLAATCLMLALAACGDPRQEELERQWAQAVRQDTVAGYVAFLAGQRKGEDGAVGEHRLHGNSGDRRSRVAAGRMFELALDTARGACPFRTVYVDLRQDIRNVAPPFALDRSGPGEVMAQMGVDFTVGRTFDRAEADEVLVLRLGGTGEKLTYGGFGDGKGTVTMVGGGTVQGEMWFASRPRSKAAFKGSYRQAVASRVEADHAARVFPRALELALDNAGFAAKFAGLVYDLCGPAAGALVYFGTAVRAHRPSKSVDPGLERRMAADLDRVRPAATAAAFGSHGHILPYDRSDKAGRFLLNTVTDGKDTLAAALKNTHPGGKLPEWLAAEAK